MDEVDWFEVRIASNLGEVEWNGDQAFPIDEIPWFAEGLSKKTD
jgi:hypothetical protein